MKQHRILIILFVLLLAAFTIAACGAPEDFEPLSDPVEEANPAVESADTSAPDEVARPQAALVIVQSPVEVRRAGAETYEEIGANSTVGAGDSIRTGDRGVAIIAFAEGTQTYLYPGGELAVSTLETAASGKLVIRLELETGLTFNSVNPDKTASHDLVAASSVVSMKGDDASSGTGSSLHLAALRAPAEEYNRNAFAPWLSTVFLTFYADNGPLGLGVNVVQGAATVNGTDVDAGQSANVDDSGEVSVQDELGLNCHDGVCTHPQIDQWVEDGTLDSPEDGEYPDYLPPADDICDPDGGNCGDQVGEGDCDPDVEDCGDQPDYGDCDPDSGDCGDQPDYGDCDPDTEDCGGQTPDDGDVAPDDGDVPPDDDAPADDGDMPPDDDAPADDGDV